MKIRFNKDAFKAFVTDYNTANPDSQIVLSDDAVESLAVTAPLWITAE